MFGILRAWEIPRNPNHKITRGTPVLKAMGNRTCESCGGYDRMTQTSMPPFIDKGGWVNVKAFCGNCGCESKWKYRNGAMIRR